MAGRKEDKTGDELFNVAVKGNSADKRLWKTYVKTKEKKYPSSCQEAVKHFSKIKQKRPNSRSEKREVRFCLHLLPQAHRQACLVN